MTRAAWPRSRPSAFLLLPFLLSVGNCYYTSKPAPSPTPALYTGQWGECADENVLSVERFGASYDSVNKTLSFGFEGSPGVEKNTSVLLQFSLEAYGTNRINLTIDPCSYNVTSLCPLNPKLPIAAAALLPVSSQTIGDLPSSDLTYPNFEGSLTLRVYTKKTKSELSCYRATITNGRSFSHPEIIAPILAAFTVAAILSSFFSAAYGVSIPHMRMHHAHSLPSFVVWETFQSIFLSGALSVEWPASLTAWWANFSWSSGVISIPSLVKTISNFAGVTGDKIRIGDAAAEVVRLGGGQVVRILARGEAGTVTEEEEVEPYVYNYTYSAGHIVPGVPLPATRMGFAATLAEHRVPVADVFILSLIWFLVAVGAVIMAIGGLKVFLEGLGKAKKIKEDRLAYFRSHWLGYLGHALMRTLVAAFFVVLTLAMYQFTMRISTGAVAVAAVMFIVMVCVLSLPVAFVCLLRVRGGKIVVGKDKVVFYYACVLQVLPWVFCIRESTIKQHALEVRQLFSIPFFRVQHIDSKPERLTVHTDQTLIKRFGWITARYRRSRWWYLVLHIAYQFCRAAFLGGGWQNPHAQIYGLLVIDCLAFATGVFLRPFESTRNNVMAVWVLGLNKIITTAISIRFLPGNNLDRKAAARLGLAIIIIQALTVVTLLILIVLSCLSTWLSLMRNREEMDPDWLEPTRARYFYDIEEKAQDSSEPWKRPGVKCLNPKEPTPPPTPRFSVNMVRRNPKIEDEDEDAPPSPSKLVINRTDDACSNTEEGDHLDPDNDLPTGARSGRHSRTSSVHSRYSVGSLPRGARPYRASWSSRDFGDPAAQRPDSTLAQRLSGLTFIIDHISDGDGAAPNAGASLATLTMTSGGNSALSLNTNTPSVSRASTPSLGRSSREFNGRSSREFSFRELFHSDAGRRSSREFRESRESRESREMHSDANAGRRPPTALPEAPEPPEDQ